MIDLTQFNGRQARVPFVRALDYPESTTQAVAWCRKHNASVSFDKDGDVSIVAGRFVGVGDTLVTAVCDAIREGSVS